MCFQKSMSLQSGFAKRLSMGISFGKDTTEMNSQNSVGLGTSCYGKHNWEHLTTWMNLDWHNYG